MEDGNIKLQKGNNEVIQVFLLSTPQLVTISIPYARFIHNASQQF